MKEISSKIFSFGLWLLSFLQRPYLWAKQKWPSLFENQLKNKREADTSRMLRRFNRLHQLFLKNSFEKISFDDHELTQLSEALRKGPIVFLMRNWGQVEYNYFNQLFLKKAFPLIVHNNAIRMGHWMPLSELMSIIKKKVDFFLTEGRWLYNHETFDLSENVKNKKPVLFCLNFSSDLDWVEENLEGSKDIFSQLIETQSVLTHPIQLIPLHFIYDRHPGREHRSLLDILLGEKENPGYLRKMGMFLRNYKKRAVAKIGNPIDLQALITQKERSEEELTTLLSRELHHVFDTETRQVTGPKLKSRKAFIRQVLENPKLRLKIRAYADENEINFDEAEKKATAYLREIASDIRFMFIELGNWIMTRVFRNLYKGIEVNEASLTQIKRVAKDSPIVLVPCHRSHMDYLLVSYIFYQRNISLPHICAGINLSFWPMGPIFRSCGAYFIRRSFEGDTFYPLLLKGYIKELMRQGYFQEFFIEGTRSRSGKLSAPKTGLLQMMVEGFLEEDLKELYFVPVSIGYDQVLEEKSYLQEEKGASKKGEKFSDLLKLPKFLRRHYGKIYLQFGSPISLRNSLEKETQTNVNSPESLQPFIKDFARNLLIEINEISTLMPAGLTAIALLSFSCKAISFEDIEERFGELLELAQAQHTPFAESLKHHPVFALEESLEHFVEENLIQKHQDQNEHFFTIRQEARPHLNFIKNTAIHAYVKLALEKLCLQIASDKDTNQLFAWIESLFKREFFFSSSQQTDPKKTPAWLSQLLLPVLSSYFIVLETSKRFPLKKIEAKVLTQQAMEVGEILLTRDKVHYAESLSQFSLQNAIHRYVEMGIFKNHQAEMGVLGRRYFSLADENKRNDVLEKLSHILSCSHQDSL